MDYKIKTIDIAPGERIGVQVRSSNGKFTGQVFEVRATPVTHLSPNTFQIELFEHAPDICSAGPCQPVYSCLSVPVEERAGAEEIMKQDQAEASSAFANRLSKDLGIDVFIIDEGGLRKA